MTAGMAETAVDNRRTEAGQPESAPLPKRVARTWSMAPPGPGWRSNAASVFWQTCWRPASEAHPRLAYSLAISTVNNISWYAAGGIGSTAVRFSGRYSRDSAGYRTLALGRPLCGRHDPARMLPRLSRRSAPAAGDSAALGSDWSRHDRAPACPSRLGPVQMIASQGVVTLGAVALCALLYRPLGLAARTSAAVSEPIGPLLREVWLFGLVQLVGLVGINAAGWWLTTVSARSDTSLVQIGFFSISHQLRNMAGLFPGLLTESSLAVMPGVKATRRRRRTK